VNPTLSLPLHPLGWSIRPDLSLRETWYTKELLPNSAVGTVSGDTVNRKALGTAIDIRPPAMERLFKNEFMGRKWKHVVEPEVTYRYLTGVDNFDNILRFDYRDILSDTNEVEYGITNRIYAKRVSGKQEDCGHEGMPNLAIGRQVQESRIPWERESQPEILPCSPQPQVREVVTWNIAQKYFFDPTFGGALFPGRRNVFTTTADLTGIAFLTGPRRFSPIISRLRIQTTARTDAEWDLDYDIQKGFINGSTAIVNYHVGQFTFGGGDAFLRSQGENTLPNQLLPPQRFNQFRLLFGYGGGARRGFSAATNVGFDANVGFLQYSAVQTSYNWDCCGITLEYRRFALGSVRNENQFRFNFALANIGSFGNLRKQEKLY
jgi:LPS-assembly protein